jgi:CRISPR-associated exonuclease Cas4
MIEPSQGESSGLYKREIIPQDIPFRVTDLKQWCYCPRILYYAYCLPDVRYIPYKVKAGIEAGKDEEDREARRSLKVYGLKNGRREFDVAVASSRYGLRGFVDMVVWDDEAKEPCVYPVDYKLSKGMGEHFRLQLTAYAVLLEESSGYLAKAGFLYSIPLRTAERVALDKRIRTKLFEALDGMHQMLYKEKMPAAAKNLKQCVICEFRRFCNDRL